jgi:hypothetical protein
MKAVEMLQDIASGARRYGDEETATEAEMAGGEVEELHDAALSLFDATSHNPASDYTGVKAIALDRLRTVLMRIKEG